MGSGHFYVGRPARAVIAVVALSAFLAILGWTRLLSNFWGWAAFILAASFVWLGLLVDSIRLARTETERRLGFRRHWYVYVLCALAIFVAPQLLVRHRAAMVGYEPFKIASASMAPTLVVGDYLMMDGWHYRAAPPRRGDVVLFRSPRGDGTTWIMRIVAVEGDTVELHNGKLVLNGREAEDPHGFLSTDPGNRELSPVRIGPGKVFVLGDNRDNAYDSRIWGTLSLADILGRARYIWFSRDFDRVGRRIE